MRLTFMHKESSSQLFFTYENTLLDILGVHCGGLLKKIQKNLKIGQANDMLRIISAYWK
jgi:hypothetical protein